MIRLRPFEEWRSLKLCASVGVDEKTLEKLVACGTCGGDGMIEDVGEITGRYFDTECPNCDGEGKVSESRQVTSDNPDFYTAQDYESEVKLDLELLSSWTHKPYWLVLFEAGFEVSFGIKERELNARLCP